MSIRNISDTLIVGIISAFIFSVSSCVERSSGVNSIELSDTIYTPQYANGFEIYRQGSSSILRIIDPWQGARGVNQDLFLSCGGGTPPADFSGIAVQSPVEKVVCMSSSYVAFIEALGCADAVRGISGARFISSPYIRERFAAGEIKDIGYDNNTDYELIAALSPDLVLAYGLDGENSPLSRKLEEMGIPVIYIGDYVEQSPLGKAEWIVAFGQLFGRREQAEEIFAGIRDSYIRTTATVESTPAKEKPVVMLNAPWRDTWFVPGDRSYMVRLIDDAGGIYACRGEDNEQTRPISGEAAFIHARQSDVWLNPGQAVTLAEVKALNPRFTEIPAVLSGRVYNCNLRITPEGGSDFWESGAVRPDIVLLDMVTMLRPDIDTGHELYYFRKM